MGKKRIRRAARLLKKEGAVSFSIKALQKVEKRQQRKSTQRKIEINFLAKHEDLVAANWSTHPYVPSRTKVSAPYTINWVMSPPGKGAGGGHQNIFRFIAFLVGQGHKCNIYLYSGQHFQEAAEAKAVFNAAYPDTEVTVQWLKGPMQPADAVFATGWETAYAVFNDPGKARKFYFVQDFEPYFYPLGSEYVLAENTYKFNFFGITAGGWLDKKLSSEYGMQTAHYDFGTNADLYKFENNDKRKEVFFYARPVTARRGFELGIMALERFHKEHPDYTITLAGWDVSEYKIPFPYVNLKTLSLEQLSEVYNRSAVALVISLTNMSLLPLELLACGTIPVVTDGQNNRQVSDNEYIKYAPASPDALAHAMGEVVTKKDLPAYAKKASQSVAQADWETAGKKFVSILEKELHG